MRIVWGRRSVARSLYKIYVPAQVPWSPKRIDDYFETLKDMIQTNCIELEAIYNCDEAAIFLSKAVDKVVVPRHAKHCHTMVKSGSEHICVVLRKCRGTGVTAVNSI